MIKESYNSPKFSQKIVHVSASCYTKIWRLPDWCIYWKVTKDEKLNTYIVFKSTIILCMPTLVRSITPTDVIKMATNKWAN